MANSKTISQVADIIIADSTRAFVVVSAPGKRDSGDVKVTDALYACAREKAEKGNCDEAFAVIEKRFVDIEKELGINIGIKKEEEPAAPTTKVCPYCKSEIPIEATRCPHCTSELDK